MLEEQQFGPGRPAAGRWTARPSSSAASPWGRATRVQIGTLLSISGDNKNLGLDSLYGVRLALDYLDGTFDQKDGQIVGHDMNLQNEDDGCSAEGGQAGATKLAANPQIVAVIGTSCSGAALGVADSMLGDKGIVLISPSNTNPALTAEGTHKPYYFRTAHNDRIQGAVVVDFAHGEARGEDGRDDPDDETPYTEGLTTVFSDKFTRPAARSPTPRRSTARTETSSRSSRRSRRTPPRTSIYLPDYTARAPCCSSRRSSPGAREHHPDRVGRLLLDRLHQAGRGRRSTGTYFRSPNLSAFSRHDFYTNQFLPAYKKLSGDAPMSAFHAHAFDASNILAKAIESMAVAEQRRDRCSILARALRDAIQSTTDYPGIVTNSRAAPRVTARPTVMIGVYKSPNLPIEGGTGDGKPGLLRDEDAGRRAGNSRAADARGSERCGWACRAHPHRSAGRGRRWPT